MTPMMMLSHRRLVECINSNMLYGPAMLALDSQTMSLVASIDRIALVTNG